MKLLITRLPNGNYELNFGTFCILRITNAQRENLIKVLQQVAKRNHPIASINL